MTRPNSPDFAPLVSESKPLKKIYFGENTDDEFVIQGFQKCLFRRCCCFILYIVTGGLGFLFLHWYKDWWLKFNAKQVPFYDAHFLLVRESVTGRCWIERADKCQWSDLRHLASHLVGHISVATPDVVSFVHKHQRFVVVDGQLVVMTGLGGLSCDQILAQSSGLQLENEIQTRRAIYGENIISVVVPPIGRILVDEILSPFYIFQVFSVILWMFDEYYIYATSILVITSVSMVVTLFNVRSERIKLQKMVEKNNFCKVRCWRGGVWTDIWSAALVPGDVVSVPPGGCFVPADCVLLSGEAIVNEGMLTGECIPVTKNALRASAHTYYPEKQKINTLFGGTEVIQTRAQSGGCTAMVVRAGFETAKGTLVQSILFPKPVNHKLEHDGMKFLLILGCVALIGFVYSIVVSVLGCVYTSMIITKSLDLITIVVPPALPAALAIGIMYAQRRLKRQNIFTVSPQRINTSGSVNMSLFDKTGTLTEDGLVYMGVLTDFDENVSSQIPVGSRLEEALAVCHSLTRINNEICGDPLDIEMFGATGWELVEPEVPEEENVDSFELTYVERGQGQRGQGQCRILQLRQFPFSSENARQTLIGQCHYGSEERELVSFIKGAPEKVMKLCDPATVPANFGQKLDQLSAKGYRILALAHKPLKIKRWKALKADRESLEENSTFLGFLILQNRVKPESAEVILELRSANIRTAMVTGDNILTAISVSTECGIISHSDKVIIPEVCGDKLLWRRNNQIKHAEMIALESLGDFVIAMTGSTFSWLVENRQSLLPFVLVRGVVFARMSPDNKGELVDLLENLDFTCSFCGDGANDCAALKRASVGVSLSELEASVASPFTAKCGNISCISDLIREGRAALMTSFGMFKYMALYSMIQFCTILILYWRKSNLSDMEYLYIDLVIIDSVALTMSLNKSYKVISQTAPPKALVTGPTIFSLLVHVLICVLFQVWIYLYTINQEWFCSISDDFPPCWEPNPDGSYSNRTVFNPNNGTVPPIPVRLDASNCTMEDRVEEYFVEHYGTVALFLFSQFQYIHMSFVFSAGKPFRQPVYKNVYFLLTQIILTASSIFILLSDAQWLEDIFELKYRGRGDSLPPLPSASQSSYRYVILITAFVNWIISWLVEEFIVENKEMWNRLKCFQKKRHINKKFLTIEDELNSNDYWPPKMPNISVKMNEL